MEKQAPSVGRILVAAGFALSCFGLFLFLWIAFGGPIPLKPESYRFTVYFPEATQLAVESDVRIGGVSVGKVKSTELAPAEMRADGKDTIAAEIEIEPEFAPISSDARAILRQKTLLGETFVELTAGSPDGGGPAPVSLGAAAIGPEERLAAATPIEEGGTLGIGQTREATQIDEIFNALDDETRDSFRRWQASAATAIRDRGLDLNDALGNLGPFISDASDVFEILERQEVALRGVVRDTGATFEALTERGQELAGAIVGSRNTFAALAQEEEALADAFKILPTFQRESRTTLERLDAFQANANPLILDLIPAARELSPALDDVRRLSPHLRDLFVDLGDLERVSERGLPALRDFLEGLRPVLGELDPFLAELNPVLRFLEYHKRTLTDFLAGPGVALSGTVDGLPGDPAPRHYLRQLSVLNTESLSIWPNRVNTNRGNGYLPDGAINSYHAAANGIFPNFDCSNTDYSPASQDPDEDEIVRGQSVEGVNNGNPPSPTYAPCWAQGPFPTTHVGDGRFPHVTPDP